MRPQNRRDTGGRANSFLYMHETGWPAPSANTVFPTLPATPALPRKTHAIILHLRESRAGVLGDAVSERDPWIVVRSRTDPPPPAMFFAQLIEL
jgi:hypothetical protein